MPSVFDGAAGDPKPHHAPPPGTVSHAMSAAFRMNQPSSAGTAPASVCSIFASCMARTLLSAAATPRMPLGRRQPRAVGGPHLGQPGVGEDHVEGGVGAERVLEGDVH